MVLVIKKDSYSVFFTFVVTFVFPVTSGIRDFVPMPVDDTYEGFGELTERANMWLSEQPENVRVTNMMSVMVQKDEGGWSDEVGGVSWWVVCLGGWYVLVGGLSWWVVCRGGWSVEVGGMSRWVVCRGGWHVEVGDLSRWVVCRGGWFAEVCGLSRWVVCRGGWSVEVGGLSRLVVCRGGWSI